MCVCVDNIIRCSLQISRLVALRPGCVFGFPLVCSLCVSDVCLVAICDAYSFEGTAIYSDAKCVAPCSFVGEEYI